MHVKDNGVVVDVMFIVAELGVNWRGNLVILDRMLERCANAQVDAVKFQSLSREYLARHRIAMVSRCFCYRTECGSYR